MQILAHGIDVVDIERIKNMLQEHGERFVRRCFTNEEIGYAETAQRRRAERFAARFACKEAVLKALGTGLRGGTTWQDMAVTHDSLGKPVLSLSGRCAILAAEMKITHWHISLSHSGDVAMASVIGVG